MSHHISSDPYWQDWHITQPRCLSLKSLGGYKIPDLHWRREAEKNVKEQIDRSRSQGATNGSLVAIDPKTGEIRALVGSADWDDPENGQINMALVPRQPGSSFKPIYYTEALNRKLITAATVIRDEPKNYDGYRPQNYDFKFRGDITVRRALGNSLNIPSIEVMKQLGVDEAVSTAQRMGISTVNDPDKYGLTLALGTAETRLLDMANAYAAFAHSGEQFSPTFITSIQDKFRRTIFTYRPRSKTVQTKEASYLISSILSDNDARAATFGSSLNISGRQVAVKTGTTDDNKDAWTIGYTPSLVVGVWVGDNQNRPMSFGGSLGAGPIWRRSIQTFLGNSPNETFDTPFSVVRQTVCNATGTYQEYFIRGTAPSTRCDTKPQKTDDKKKQDDKKRDDDNQTDSDNSNSDSQTSQPSNPTPQPQPSQPSPSPTPQPEPTPTEPPEDSGSEGDGSGTTNNGSGTTGAQATT